MIRKPLCFSALLLGILIFVHVRNSCCYENIRQEDDDGGDYHYHCRIDNTNPRVKKKSIEQLDSLLYGFKFEMNKRSRLEIRWRPKDGSGKSLSMSSSYRKKNHVFRVPRMFADTDYEYKVCAGKGTPVSAGMFTTGSLPYPLDQFNSTVYSSGGSIPMYMTNTDVNDLYLYALDVHTGKIVWYIHSPQAPYEQASLLGWHKHPEEGNSYTFLKRASLNHITYWGKTINYVNDIVPIPESQYTDFPPEVFSDGCGQLHHWMASSGDYVYALGERIVPIDGKCYFDDVVWRWNRRTGEMIEWLKIADVFPIDTTAFYPPLNIDWTGCGPDRINWTRQQCVDRFHGNYIAVSDWNGYIVINGFTGGQNGVTLIVDPDTKQLIHKITNGARSDFSFIDQADRFYATHFTDIHAPDPDNPFTTKHRMVTFDNGKGRPVPSQFEAFSRAVIYELDLQEMTIKKVFEYRMESLPDSVFQPYCYAQITGTFMELPNGNMFANFPCNLVPQQGVVVRNRAQLVEIDSQGNRLSWMQHVTSPPPASVGWVVFATPLYAIADEKEKNWNDFC